MNVELQKLYDKTVRACKLACTDGIILTDGEFKDCTCLTVFRKKATVINANIPRKYRDFRLSHLTGNFQDQNAGPMKIITKYAENLARNIDSGYGLFFQSEAGLGKTALSCWLLMKALAIGKKGYFIQYSDLITLFYRNLNFEDKEETQAAIDQINDADIVCIDRIDNGYIKNDYALSKVDQIFNMLYNNQTALIVTSNAVRDQLSSFQFMGTLDETVDIVLTGAPYRNDSKAIREIMS